MLNARSLERTREALDTWLSQVRPQPSERSHYDVSYQLTDVAFVLTVHLKGTDALNARSTAFCKGVHHEELDGWQLYVMSSSGHWVPSIDLPGIVELEDVLDMATALLPKPSQQSTWSIAS